MKSIRWQAFETAENKAFGNACCCRQTAAKAILATVQIDGKTYNVTKIAANVFKGCKKLKAVTIGKKVKVIKKNAFYGIKTLKKITFKGKKVPKIGKNAFKGIAKNAKFKVPKKA